MVWLLAFFGLLLAAALGWRWSSRRKAGAARGANDDIDTLSAWTPQPTRVLSAHERLAHSTLVRALPDYLILAQVPLARFLRVPTRHSYAEWLQRVGHLCADFVVCDRATQVLAVVEVVRAEPPNERRQRRQERMDHVLRSAGIPILRWTEGRLPGVDAARRAVLDRVTSGEPPAQTTARSGSSDAHPTAPPPSAEAGASNLSGAAKAGASRIAGGRDEGLASGGPALPSVLQDPNGEPVPDEMIEVREPPPSTWFHDLDPPRSSERDPR